MDTDGYGARGRSACQERQSGHAAQASSGRLRAALAGAENLDRG